MDKVSKVGRKKIYTEERKQIPVRVSLTEYKALCDLAEKEEKTISEFVGEILTEQIQFKLFQQAKK